MRFLLFTQIITPLFTMPLELFGQFFGPIGIGPFGPNSLNGWLRLTTGELKDATNSVHHPVCSGCRAPRAGALPLPLQFANEALDEGQLNRCWMIDAKYFNTIAGL